MRKRRILSLLLAVAVTATMLIAVPLTASADVADAETIGATSNQYVEWDFLSLSTDVPLYKNSDYLEAESGTPVSNQHYYLKYTSDKPDNADPTIEAYRSGTLALNNQGTFKNGGITLTTLGNKTYNTSSNAQGTKSSPMIHYDINPDVPENHAANIYIAFAATSNATDGAALSYAGGSSSKTSAKESEILDIVIWKLEDIKEKITIQSSGEVYIFYIGLEYVLSDGSSTWTYSNEEVKASVEANKQNPDPVEIGDLTVDPLEQKEWVVPASPTPGSEATATAEPAHWVNGEWSISDYLTGNKNPKEETGKSNPSVSKIPACGTVLKVNVAKAGTLSVTMNVGANKTAKILEVPKGQESSGTFKVDERNTEAEGQKTFTCEAVPANDYYLYVEGSKTRFYTIKLTPPSEPSASSDPGTDTETVTAAGYSNSFKSTNKNYVDWTFHKETDPEDKYADITKPEYRTENGLAASFSNKPAISISGSLTSRGISGDVKTDAFDLPHTEHSAHSGNGYVLKAQIKQSLTITNAKPDDTVNSYDLIIVYNRNKGDADPTEFTIRENNVEGKTLCDPYTDNGDNNRDTDPDEVIFRNVNVKDVNLAWNKEIDIYSVSLDYHKQSLADAESELKLERGTGDDYISGIYYKDNDDTNDERGVIRFFQDCGENADIDGYGFVFLNADADVIDTNIRNGRIVQSNDGDGALSGKTGFYGDVYNILATNYGKPVIAVPYVSVDGYIIFAETSIKGTVDDTDNKVIREPEWEWTVTE